MYKLPFLRGPSPSQTDIQLAVCFLSRFFHSAFYKEQKKKNWTCVNGPHVGRWYSYNRTDAAGSVVNESINDGGIDHVCVSGFFFSFSSFVVPRIAITSVFLADTHYFMSSGSAAWSESFYSKMISYVYRFLPARLQMNGIIAERDGPIQRRKDVAIAGSRTACY